MSVPLLSAPLTATADSGTHLELGALVIVAVIFIALLLVRAKQSRDQKIRKAASAGYFDTDLARYGRGPGPDTPAVIVPDDADRAWAPTFVAPVRKNRAPKRGAAVPPPPRPATNAFGTGYTVPPRPVPAFDQVVAISNRPASTRAQPAPPTPSTAPAAPLPPIGPWSEAGPVPDRGGVPGR